MKKEPTAWKFVWNDTGRFFSSLSKDTIELYAEGAIGSFGEDCGRIEPMFDDNPEIARRKIVTI